MDQVMRSTDSHAGRTAEFGFIALPLIGLVGLVAFAISNASSLDEFLGIFASSLLFACASTAGGAFLGFLFGVPRTLTSGGSGQSSGRIGGIGANTNLEQVSDWLTKILIGATLTQLGVIPSAAARLFDAMSASLGSGSGGAAFAGAIVIYFGILGFLVAWLATRLFLGRAMFDADAARLLATANAVQAEDPEKAAALRGMAEDVAVAASPSAWTGLRSVTTSLLGDLIAQSQKAEEVAGAGETPAAPASEPAPPTESETAEGGDEGDDSPIS